MAGFKIHEIKIDKDTWENVPQIVVQSFKAVNGNMSNIKDWVKRTDDKLKQSAEHYDTMERGLSSTDTALRATEEQLHELSGELRNLLKRSDKECHTFTSCIKQLLDASLMFFEQFMRSFGQVPQASLKNEELEPDTVSDHQTELKALMLSRSNLEEHLNHMNDAFDVWGQWKATAEDQNELVVNKVAELQVISENTRDELLTWQETLKESRQDVESVHIALKVAQNDVQLVKEEQVSRNDVDDIVSERARDLEELRNLSERRIDSVQGTLEKHIGNVGNMLKEMETCFKDKIEDHGVEVRAMFEREVNPINAYLNNMHVKADVVRVELDGVCKQVPQLQTSIEDMSSQFKLCNGDLQERCSQLNTRIDELTTASLKSFERSDTGRTALSDNLHKMCYELGGRLSELRILLEATSQAITGVKQGEIPELSKELKSLEQKVAKWIHSAPLPAKVSEARLYALEAKLAEETKSRFRLEAQLSDDAMRERCSSKGVYSARASSGLPSLASQASRPVTRDNTSRGGRREKLGESYSPVLST